MKKTEPVVMGSVESKTLSVGGEPLWIDPTARQLKPFKAQDLVIRPVVAGDTGPMIKKPGILVNGSNMSLRYRVIEDVLKGFIPKSGVRYKVHAEVLMNTMSMSYQLHIGVHDMVTHDMLFTVIELDDAHFNRASDPWEPLRGMVENAVKQLIQTLVKAKLEKERSDVYPEA